MFKRTDYQSEINLNPNWTKFDSPENFQRILTFLVEVQWIPSQVTIERAIANLQLPRTDGRTSKDDARAQVKEAEKKLQQAILDASRSPITRAEADEFASLSYQDLQRRFWENNGTNTFAVRYRLASAQMGFRLPAKPVVDEDDSGDIELTPELFRTMPARELQVKMRSPRVKLQIMRMIRAGQI